MRRGSGDGNQGRRNFYRHSGTEEISKQGRGLMLWGEMSLDGMKRENLARRGRGSGNGKFGFVFAADVWLAARYTSPCEPALHFGCLFSKNIKSWKIENDRRVPTFLVLFCVFLPFSSYHSLGVTVEGLLQSLSVEALSPSSRRGLSTIRHKTPLRFMSEQTSRYFATY